MALDPLSGRMQERLGRLVDSPCSTVLDKPPGPGLRVPWSNRVHGDKRIAVFLARHNPSDLRGDKDLQELRDSVSLRGATAALNGFDKYK
ncbi:uncharacterized protein DSM5745_06190 [Aspergillus mulundensis]|uniref:Uncharacterized protein n=1 Tax=Aspergillus mulundensis TaxID=1810919 RepID=A0A3D8RZA2_9EURO|nr:hypothetical protein DSM5745_06190 [Aspergillus mulundensis]RDW79338.1 hypothetical protein DSM5745_06190 [Aspergillus mulundensis]